MLIVQEGEKVTAIFTNACASCTVTLKNNDCKSCGWRVLRKKDQILRQVSLVKRLWANSHRIREYQQHKLVYSVKNDLCEQTSAWASNEHVDKRAQVCHVPAWLTLLASIENDAKEPVESAISVGGLDGITCCMQTIDTKQWREACIITRTKFKQSTC
jgi:hypothetical protein